MLEMDFGTFPILLTRRLLLREITDDDSAAILLLRSNPQIMRYLDRPTMRNLEEAKSYIEKNNSDYLQQIGISWIITVQESKELLGTVGFWRFDKANHRAEIGYMLLPQYWGKGMATEALAVVIPYAFNTLKLHSIEANVNPENEASKKLLIRTGFKQEAYFRENYFFDGRFLDSAIYCLLASDLAHDSMG
jgi:[ribosomal protein S5]-alanine N-acetyltransferase